MAPHPLSPTIPQSPAPRDRRRVILQAGTFRGVPPLSLSVRLLLLVLLAVIPAVCIEIYGEVELRASRRQEIRDEALRLVRVVAAEQERIDEGTRQLLIAFSEAAAVRAGDWDGCNETAKRVRAQIDGYVNIGIASNEGMIKCAGIEGLAGVELRDNSLRGRIAADTSFAIGNYQLGRITGRKILLYTKEVGKGTGLGLSMVYGVARQFGGAAAIDSAPGKGTTVALFLPRRGGRVLVVDDDLDVREVTIAALAEIGVEASAAASGKAALDLVDRGAPIDLMIVDYAMPGMNGAEVIARARALRPQLPIILITGYAEAGLAADLPEDVQLLRKPLRVSELLARVGSDIGAGARAERSNILPLRQTQKPG
jgi:CheY-like chemotaxis protein